MLQNSILCKKNNNDKKEKDNERNAIFKASFDPRWSPFNEILTIPRPLSIFRNKTRSPRAIFHINVQAYQFYRNRIFGSRQSVSADVLISERRRKVCSIESIWELGAIVSGDPTLLWNLKRKQLPPFQSQSVTKPEDWLPFEGRNCTSSKVVLWN